MDVFRIAERELSSGDARYFVERRDDFIGIWDRERPAEPVERFPASDEGEFAAAQRVHALLFEHELSAKQTPGARLYLPPWLEGAAPCLIVEEEEDERWRVLGDSAAGSRFHLYALGGHGEELMCRGRFATVEQAQQHAAKGDHALGEWREVPVTVTRTLMATLRWAQRERAGPAELWWERFNWINASRRAEGALSFARVFEGTAPVAVVLASEGADTDAAAFLLRPRDEPRLVYSVDALETLLGLLPNYLADVTLGEWRALPDDWPRDVASLAPRVLRLAGVA